jgi:hypothetical protein
MDTEGHLAYQGGKPLPGLCHCDRNEAHDAEPTAPAPPEAYGWQPPVDGTATVECWGGGTVDAASGADFDVVAYVSKWGPPGVGPGWELYGRTSAGEPIWRPLYQPPYG